MTRLIPYQGYVVPQEFFTTCNKCYERNIYIKFKIQSWMKIQIKDIYNAIFVMQKYM